MEVVGEWRFVVRSWADEAEVVCIRAHGLLAEAEANLATPMLVADTQDVHVRALLATNILSKADDALAYAATIMASAQIFAYRCGGAPSTATPLHLIDALPAAHRSMWFALGMLQLANRCADEACDRVAQCFARLHTVAHLLGHRRLHGLDDIIDAERVAARDHLLAAQDIVLFGANLAATAVSLVP